MSDLSKKTINENQLEDVNAGTFNRNDYPQWVYEHAGFECEFHFLDRDEFILNGRVYNEDEANAILASMGYSKGTGHTKSGKARTIYLCNGEQIHK